MRISHFLVFIATLPIFISSLFAEPISKIEYIGCKRIEPETIESYLNLQVGSECNSDSINDALKALDATGFFEEVSIETHGSVLIVKVKEAPIINKISFEGNSKLSDKDIEKAIRLKAKETLSPARIKEIQQGLLEVYRKMGRFNASIHPKIIRLPNNQVNLIFEINEGESAGIGRIVFVGNNAFSASQLRNVIYSKVKRWYRFFVTDDIYDRDRTEQDKAAVVRFYKEKGYADARVSSATAELSHDKKEFVITFAIDEGSLYKLGDISVNSHIDKLSNKDLAVDLYCKNGDVFNSTLVDVDSAMIARKACEKGYPATRVEPKMVRTSENVAGIIFHVFESDRIYISKIVIKGNTRTREHIIRREIGIEEGDILSQTMISIAENKLQSLGYFKSVNIQTIRDSTAPDRCILQISVEEGSTGEAMIAASYSTQEGVGVDLSYNESNFLGTGKSLSVFLGSNKTRVGKSYEIDSVTGKETKVPRKSKFRFLGNVSVSVSDPHIFDKDITGTCGAFRYQSGCWDAFSMKELGGFVGASYALSSKISQSWDYTLTSRKFEDVMPHASPIIKYQTMKKEGDSISATRPGKCDASSVKHSISYATPILTGMKGSFRTSLSTTFAGLGGDARHLKNELHTSYRWSLDRTSNVLFAFSCGVTTGIGTKKPNEADSFRLGLDSLRGFDDCGLGPQAETWRAVATKHPILDIPVYKASVFRDFIGAKKYWKGTVEYTFPIGLPEELCFRGFVFTDFGTLWDAPEKGKDFLVSTGKRLIVDKHNNVSILEEGKTPSDPDSVMHNIEHVTCEFDKDPKSLLVSHKILDSRKIRASLGLGISLVTPLGPLKFTYAFPVRKEKYDEPFRFLLGFSTTF
jgi:outer membrane protein insertion porin family